MTDQQRAVVSTTCKASVTNSVAESEYIQFEAIRANIEERGVTVHEWPKEMLDAFEGAWEEVATEQRKDPTFAAVYDDLQTFRSNYKLWSSRAFLPRD
tara:strand:- start:2117 stop:2410 length:294 start_codon:yes stop_codon:yes gene_type:complete